MNTGIQSNLFLTIRRRCPATGRTTVTQRAQHNLFLDGGLAALAGNCVNTTGGIVNQILWSDSAVAPVATDTTLASTLLTSKMLGHARTTQGVALFYFKLPFDVGDELSVNGSTIASIGMKTSDSGGAKPSDDKLVAATLLDPAIPKDAFVEITGTWVISFAPVVADGEQWYLGWRRFLASKLQNLSDFGILDYVAFGTASSSTKPDPESEALVTAVHRKATTWTVTLGVISCSATLLQAEYSAATLVEMGVKSGAVANEDVFIRRDGFSVDMTANNGAYAIDITLSRG